MAPFEILYGRRCRTLICWFQDEVHLTVGPEMLQETKEKVELIREKLSVTQSRQKSYGDRRRRPLEFEILHCRGPVDYEPALPPQLIRDDLSVEVQAAHIKDTRVKKLRGKSIRLVKLVWDLATRDATWKLEEKMREELYLYLFSKG
ncbi:uncharacterized protein LOC113862318 [Abrus precatorius]|uniref:Uncharacterized protein LOC113862318 n=1 Tax=Abrus precatorius TaxID=3816 RepID=A0A8B8L8Z0_ABRPR|nr:uncharacterized protein LOC113862318 [Abrus precatorius]